MQGTIYKYLDADKHRDEEAIFGSCLTNLGNFLGFISKLFGNAELRRSVGIVQSGICQYVLALK